MALPASVDHAGGDRRPARLLNISLGGACVELAEQVDVGQLVTLHVETPVLWDPLIVQGLIVWTDDDPGERGRAGLRFDHERSHVIRALFELLATEEFD